MKSKYSAVVVGVSAGGLKALSVVLSGLPKDFPLSIAIVQHRRAEPGGGYMIEHLRTQTHLQIKAAGEKEHLIPGMVYIAPPGYHLLIERDRTFALSVDPPVQFARPSIDVLFDSAAFAYEGELIGVILTGANRDGAAGLAMIRERGGTTIVQDPKSAQAAEMPQAALDATDVDYIRPLEEIAAVLLSLGGP